MGRLRISTIALSELHYALLDFLVSRLGKAHSNRTDLIRLAIEDFIVKNQLWDADEFNAFAEEYAANLKTKATREVFIEDLKVFLQSRCNDDGGVFKMPEAWDLDVSTNAGTFK